MQVVLSNPPLGHPHPLPAGASYAAASARTDPPQSTQYNKLWLSNFNAAHSDPNQLRWRPFDIPAEPLDFVQGIATVCGAGASRMGRAAPRSLTLR